MSARIPRRQFLTGSAILSAGLAVPGRAAEPAPTAAPSVACAKVVASAKGTLPTGKIGKLTLSRLVSGGNLISGWAHSRDLHYVPSLMRHYNTDEKVMDTLQLLEEHGVNTIISDPRERPMHVFSRYWKERGGKMQWIAEGHPASDDWKTNLKTSIDFGASAVYIQGAIGDRWLKEGHLDLLGNCV